MHMNYRTVSPGFDLAIAVFSPMMDVQFVEKGKISVYGAIFAADTCLSQFKLTMTDHLTQRRSASIETVSNKASCHFAKSGTSARDIDRYIAYFEVDETAKV